MRRIIMTNYRTGKNPEDSVVFMYEKQTLSEIND